VAGVAEVASLRQVFNLAVQPQRLCLPGFLNVNFSLSKFPFDFIVQIWYY